MHTTKQSIIIGWDIGGAHTKAALLQNSVLQEVIQVACPLWRGLDELVQAIHSVLNTWQLGKERVCHAITMTGELVDLFPNRKEGVINIAQTLEKELLGTCCYYSCDATLARFIDFSQLQACWESIASANWHASTSLIAQQVSSGLFIDIGSTTTDITVMHQNKLHNAGDTDASRMLASELVYTGVVRTPVMALGPVINWLEQDQPIAAEYFATTADVYRMTAQLVSDADMSETADGGDKSTMATAIRLARMVGHDVEDYPMSHWVTLAKAFKAKQLSLIAQAVKKQLDRLLEIAVELNTIEIVSAGVGSFLVKEVIAELQQNGHYPKMQVHQSDTILSQLATNSNMRFHVAANEWAGHCLPAVAVATIANQTSLHLASQR